MFRRFLTDEGGATAVEYAAVAMFLSLLIVAGVGTAADAIQWMWSSNESKLQQVLVP